MSGIDILGLAVLGLFLGLLIFYLGFGMRWPAVFRPIRGYEVLGTSIERAVEAGERVHLSLGTGSIIGTDSAPAFAGLVMLKRIGREHWLKVSWSNHRESAQNRTDLRKYVAFHLRLHGSRFVTGVGARQNFEKYDR